MSDQELAAGLHAWAQALRDGRETEKLVALVLLTCSVCLETGHIKLLAEMCALMIEEAVQDT